jgi:hypothetical protein
MSSVSLDQPLPAEISRRVSFPLMRYLNYPAFSWDWFWRRGIIFAAGGVMIAVMSGINVGLQVGDSALGWRTFWNALPFWLCLTLLGSALGTVVRYRRLPLRLERWMLPLAVVAATGVGVLGQRAYFVYYREIVLPVMLEKGFATQEMLEISSNLSVRAANMGLFVALAFTLSGGFALRAYFRERRFVQEFSQQVKLREQRDMSDRRLSLLQAQVEPHFLYNTLASVRSLVNTDPQRAVATIDALVDHLRATLPKMREHDDARSTLTEQVEICRSYLEVMKVRMGVRLRYSVQVPDDCGPLFFPPLMLISLVENAIKHGVEPKPGACFVTIAARRFVDSGREQLEVCVIDDGMGLREGASGGIGLANIRAQLATRYGDRAELSLESRATGGVAARITIPVESHL